MKTITSEILSNERSYELFFNEHYNALCRFAFTFLKDADDAEEIVQNIFVKLWNDREGIEIKTSVKSYLFTAVRNASLNQLKHIDIKETYKQHNQLQIQQGYNIDGEMEASELQEKITNAIQSMPEQRKKIFGMSRFEGLKYKEIAKQLNISPKTVENHMGIAIKFLREELKEYLHLIVVIIIIEGLGEKLF